MLSFIAKFPTRYAIAIGQSESKKTNGMKIFIMTNIVTERYIPQVCLTIGWADIVIIQLDAFPVNLKSASNINNAVARHAIMKSSKIY